VVPTPRLEFEFAALDDYRESCSSVIRPTRAGIPTVASEAKRAGIPVRIPIAVSSLTLCYALGTVTGGGAVLAAATLACGGLLIRVPLAGEALAKDAVSSPLNAYVRTDAGGEITLLAPYVEMGQGAHAS
jgi:hypothetical protein